MNPVKNKRTGTTPVHRGKQTNTERDRARDTETFGERDAVKSTKSGLAEGGGSDRQKLGEEKQKHWRGEKGKMNGETFSAVT